MNRLSIEAADEALQSPIPALPPDLRRIVLTGFMGAGKSTVGRLLATEMHWDFLDLDAHLEARTSATIPEIFERHGEPHFRRLESSALASALRQTQLVLALGGGAPETLTNRLLLEQTPGTLTIFLDAPFATLFDRCMLQALNPGSGADHDTDRPNLRDPDAAQARFNLRHPLYRRMARITVGTAGLSPEGTVSVLLEAVGKLA